MEVEVPEVDAARARFRDRGAARLEGVLDAGLVAELGCYLPTLGPEVRQFLDQQDLSWACEVGVPEGYDPQYPACLYRLVEFLDHELPALASRVTGRTLVPAAPRRVHVWSFRCGAYVDAGKPLAPAGGIDVFVGLTAARWPTAWGGHLELDGGEPLPLGPGTVDLIGDAGFKVSILTHHVEALMVRTLLRAA